MNIDLRLFRWVRSAWAPMILSTLGGVAAGVLVIFQARQISRILDSVFLDARGLADQFPALWVLLGVIILRGVLYFLSDWQASLAAVRIKSTLRMEAIRKLFHHGPGRLKQEQTGELAATLIEGVEALDPYFSQYLPQLAFSAFIPLAILISVIPVDGLTAVVLAVTAPLIPFFMVLIGSAAGAETKKRWGALSRLSAHFLDSLQGLTTLKALNQAQQQATRLEASGERYRLATMNVLRITFLSALALELLATISTAVVAVEIGLRLLYGRIFFEQAFFILLIAPEFYMPLRMLGTRFHAGSAGVAAAARIFEILDQNKDVPGTSLLPAGQVPDHFEGISLRGVSYCYPDGNSDALEDISLDIPTGQHVALVGHSGSGKSTLMGLLLKWMEPQSGEIIIGDVGLARVDRATWFRQIAWVPQRTRLSTGSIAANLRMGKRDATTTQLWEVLEQVHLADWVASLPAGLDYMVGEGGRLVSSGQAQRLAVARALLKDAPFVLLDEPTAHLDPEQETWLVDAMRRLLAGRTSLTIAHRLSTLSESDLIYVLKDGRLVEQGTFAELSKAKGEFNKLLEHVGARG